MLKPLKTKGYVAIMISMKDYTLIWDNRAVLHRGHPYDEVNDRRLMIHTTIAGVAPTVVDGRIQAGA